MPLLPCWNVHALILYVAQTSACTNGLISEQVTFQRLLMPAPCGWAARLLPLTVVHMAAFNSRMWIGVHVGHNGHRLLESPGANQVMQCQITQ